MNAKYKELFDLAYEYQKKDNIEKAEEIYLALLSVNAEDFNVLNLLGMLYLSKKDYEKAILYISKAVVLNKSAYFLSNLAKSYFLNKQYDKSVELYFKALEVEENDDIYYSLGLAYKALKQPELAIKNYLKAINLNPDNYNAYYNIALLYKEMNNSEIAIDFCLKGKQINSSDVDLYTLLSSLYENVGDYKNAIKSLEQALYLKNNNPHFYYNLGVLYSKINQVDNSLKNYLKVLESLPNDIETLVAVANIYRDIDKDIALSYATKAFEINKTEANVVLVLSQIYRDLYENEKSVEILEEFLKTNDKNSEIYYQLALNNMDLGQYTNALQNYEKALSFNSSNLSYLKGKAIALKYLGEEKLSFELLNEIYEKDKNSNSTAVSLGMCLLKNKDFEKGMELYSKRSTDTKFVKLFSSKIWDKTIDINNKKVLIYSDCGLGDSIMFARYLPLLKEKVSALTVQTDFEILSLLKENFKDINFISKTDERPDYDVVMPIMDISYSLNSNFDSIPFTNHYLTADEKKISEFKKLDIFNNSDFKIGVCYQGNKRVLKNRSIDIERLSELFNLSGAKFYSFQLNIKDDRLEDLSTYIKDYSDTSALLSCMDLLITIDSSIVHVAGALGIKTYLMLPKTSEWRWFDDSQNSSWYDSVRIFKQNISNDWTNVIFDIKNELITNELK